MYSSVFAERRALQHDGSAKAIAYTLCCAQVAELVDAHGSGPCAARCGGSSPLLGTNPEKLIVARQSAFFMPRAEWFSEERCRSRHVFAGQEKWHLARAKCQIPYQHLWWVLTGSNRRPTPCKGAALPAELSTLFSITWLGHVLRLFLKPQTANSGCTCCKTREKDYIRSRVAMQIKKRQQKL